MAITVIALIKEIQKVSSIDFKCILYYLFFFFERAKLFFYSQCSPFALVRPNADLAQ